MTAAELRVHFPLAPESFIRRNSDQPPPPTPSIPAKLPPAGPTDAKSPKPRNSQGNAVSGQKRIRQDSKGPNKTEREFAAYLRAACPDRRVLVQAITLLVANGCRYTPDVVSVTQHSAESCTLTAYEIKGFMRDDAAVKLKVAASLFRFIQFFLVTKRTKKEGGGWDIQGVLP